MEVFCDFERIYEEFSGTVYRLAFARVKNKYDADDVLQDVFIKFFKKYPNLRNEDEIKAVLIKMTVNRTKNLFSSAHFKKTAALDCEIGVDMPDFETLDAVLRLPLKYRTVIHLHYYCGFKTEEIASLLSLKPSTVKSQLFRAREKLKKELEGIEF